MTDSHSPADKGAPFRKKLDWQNPEFYNEENLDEELRRVFDVCHGCRRCFNLCDSFPKLFDLIDESPTGELDGVASKDFGVVADSCTLCDICFVNKCPYVPPHEFDIDFPHLMLRAKAVEAQKNGTGFVHSQMVQMDRNGAVGTKVAGAVNWATDAGNKVTRPILEKIAGIHKSAAVPKFASQTFVAFDKKNPATVNTKAPGYGEKVVLYATCYGNYHETGIAKAARAILAHNGVDVVVDYPGCCGMPTLEQGQIEKVAKQARDVSAKLNTWVEKGYTILALVPSCALMLKHEWPLILPDDSDVALLAKHTKDISEYLVELFKAKGMAEGLTQLGDDITLHLACHSRAQNIGNKAADLLRMIPETKVDVIERCSGHGGSWGMMVDHFEVAMKVGKPVFREAVAKGNHYVASECPLATAHIAQGLDREKEGHTLINLHPLEIFAKAYGLV